MKITREQFLKQKDPRFGRTNPERMEMPFWELMVAGKYWAYWARDKFNYPPVKDHEPIWCFDRYGMSKTKLSDGRIIYIGGEHEDWYDVDFNIYNDVIVRAPDKTLSIFGYPKEVFPPTDFHTATLIGERILIIGSLGYVDSRQSGVTSVYWLDCHTHRIEKFNTTGDTPGWIWEHTAKLEEDGRTLIIRGGKIFHEDEQSVQHTNNRKRYKLDVIDGFWSRIK